MRIEKTFGSSGDTCLDARAFTVGVVLRLWISLKGIVSYSKPVRKGTLFRPQHAEVKSNSRSMLVQRGQNSIVLYIRTEVRSNLLHITVAIGVVDATIDCLERSAISKADGQGETRDACVYVFL